MSLDQPFRLLNLFTEILESRPEGNCMNKHNLHKFICLFIDLFCLLIILIILLGDTSITGSEKIDEIIATLSKENIERMLKYIRDWNTNAKHSRTAQTVLNVILKNFSSQDLLEITDIKEVHYYYCCLYNLSFPD